MKILYITGGDYTALLFEQQYKGTPVSELIDMVEKGLLVADDDHGLDGEEYEMYPSVIETNIAPDDPFISFVRGVLQDHDQSNHSNFWLENEVI